jgi:hypothetical protein
VVREQGRLNVPVIDPGQSTEITIEAIQDYLQFDEEIYLDLSAHLKEANLWAGKDFRIAHEQFRIKDGKRFDLSNAMEFDNPLEIVETEKGLEISGRDFNLILDRASGAISEYHAFGNLLIKQGPENNFWRAPTDNDEGRGDISFAHQWREAGLNEFTYENSEFIISKRANDMLGIQLTGSILAKAGKILHKRNYVVENNGIIRVRNHYELLNEFPPLPKVGNRYQLPISFNKITWYGRGPHENYSDRKLSAKIGRYSGSVKQQYVPYVSPQENGNKTDVRWLRINDQNNNGFYIVADSLIDFSIHHYTLENLTEANHTYDLDDADFITLNVDLGQMGLGGDDSWSPRVHPEYQLTDSTYTFSYSIIPLQLIPY